jgi:hypothetical protein
MISRFMCVVLGAWWCCSCLDRPLGLDQPRTTSVISDRFRQATPAKLDLLLVIDNSGSMADKQQVLAQAIPDLIESLTLPACEDTSGNSTRRHAGDGPCPPGTVPQFRALSDIQVGVITTSLGGFGAQGALSCKTEPEADMAHLLPTRPRAQHIPSNDGVLSWKEGEPLAPFVDTLKQLVPLATDKGCGLEAPLEAWYRFLVDPAPYVSMDEPIPCSAEDSGKHCAQAKRGPDGARLVDQTVLAQRAKFLRPDSLLAVVMLTDENDCSFAETSIAPLLTQWSETDDFGPPRASTACASNPDDACCHSCVVAPPMGCPTELDAHGTARGLGCKEAYYAPGEDASNLRCFDQKRRFGMDLLNPIARYTNALTQPKLCFKSTSLDPASCLPAELSPNPLFFANGQPSGRKAEDIFLVGVVGVPWQDLAVSPDANVPLEYLPAVNSEGAAINWDWVTPAAGTRLAKDPLLWPSVEARVGTSPVTNAPLAPSTAGYYANPVNGHEWPNGYRNDLQYACIFPLPQPIVCLPGEDTVCDCKDGFEVGNPLCQSPNGSYGTTQVAAKAYPGGRELAVLRSVGEVAVVASICAKEMADVNAPDYGYRPAMQAVVDRVRGRLLDICLDRRLSVRTDNTAACRIVEVQPNQAECSCTGVRTAPDAALRASVEARMVQHGLCSGPTGCASNCECEIVQLRPAPGESTTACQTDRALTGVGDGWCYLDEAAGIGVDLVKECDPTQRQKIRFVGEGITRDGSFTYYSCQGSTYSMDE